MTTFHNKPGIVPDNPGRGKPSSGNLFIYYEEGNPQAHVAPDVEVVNASGS
jgi:hypothetical protein